MKTWNCAHCGLVNNTSILVCDCGDGHINGADEHLISYKVFKYKGLSLPWE